MKIEITESDITNGKASHPQECPLGRALARMGLKNFAVTGICIVLGATGAPKRALLLPEAVEDWIFDFDEARPVKPITFEVGLPIPAVITDVGAETDTSGAWKRRRMFFAQMGAPETQKDRATQPRLNVV